MNENQSNEKPRLDLPAIRQKLAGTSGKRYWRSLEEVSDQPEFRLWMEDEFPNRSTLLQINRRDLLKFMGASMALAGMAGCRSVFLPEDKVVPYVKQPEELVPGKALFYASAMPLSGYATGVLVEQHEGRPTFIAGNPDHPASLGACDSLTSAEVLNLYDPDRADNVQYQGDISTIETFDTAVAAELQKASKGSGLRILTGSITSPTLIDQIEKFLKRFPNAQWHAYEPTGRSNIYEGAVLVFGRPLEPIYDFSNAEVIVSLDSDFLNPAETPGSLRYARDFASKRRVLGSTGTMNRLYAYESTPGLVGAIADHRFRMKAGDVYAAALALAASLGIPGVPQNAVTGVSKAIATDLQANVGKVIVIAGKHQPPEVHALAFAMTEALGGAGHTIKFVQPIDVTATSKVQDLKSLVDDLNKGHVDQLFIIDGNPVYDAPSDFKFAEALPKAKFKVRVGKHYDETTQLCDWHIPQTHPLEEWGDCLAYDGTVTFIQPIVAPLYSGLSALEFFGRLNGNARGGYEMLRAYWKQRGMGKDYERSWRIAIHDGLLKGTASKPVAVTAKVPALTEPKASAGLEINFRTDPTIYDGRFANNGWLQELPKPLTKATWDNLVYISAKTAADQKVSTDDRVEVSYKGVSVQGAVFVFPGHPDDSITLHLGYGRTQGGIVATLATEDNHGENGGGFNVYPLRTSDAMWIGSGAELKLISTNSEDTATTQGHQPIDGDRISDDRKIIYDWSLSDFLSTVSSKVAARDKEYEEDRKQNLYPEQTFQWDGAEWAMTIDMNTCIGCNACVTACQAENNIPVVGKMQVARHREMHWLRIDRYYSGTDENPAVTWQPVACVQCEKAPCEPVCPVAATVHSHEGLNQMIYNRCVGTRYCSNNCPYKVRRFNYLNYTDNQPNFSEMVYQAETGNALVPGPYHIEHKQGIALLKMVNNPDVTVRGRGIMEKCSYCVQRINEARIESKKTNTPIKDGDIVTACQAACPTETIVFGNKADVNSRVSRLRDDPRAYLLLEELQTRPRTSHLARLRNPNPDIPNAPHFVQPTEV